MLVASPAPNHGVVQGTPTGTAVEGFTLLELHTRNMKILARLVSDIAAWARGVLPAVLTVLKCDDRRRRGSLLRLQVSYANLFVLRSVIELPEDGSAGPASVFDDV